MTEAGWPGIKPLEKELLYLRRIGVDNSRLSRTQLLEAKRVKLDLVGVRVLLARAIEELPSERQQEAAKYEFGLQLISGEKYSAKAQREAAAVRLNTSYKNFRNYKNLEKDAERILIANVAEIIETLPLEGQSAQFQKFLDDYDIWRKNHRLWDWLNEIDRLTSSGFLAPTYNFGDDYTVVGLEVVDLHTVIPSLREDLATYANDMDYLCKVERMERQKAERTCHRWREVAREYFQRQADLRRDLEIRHNVCGNELREDIKRRIRHIELERPLSGIDALPTD